MIETSGVVTAIEGDRVLVKIEQQGCGRCHEEGGCGGANLGNMLCRTPEVFRLKNPGGVEVGEHVTIVIPEAVFRLTTLRIYVIPLGAVLAGAFGGLQVAGELGGIVGAVGGLLSAWLGVRLCGYTHSEPQIKR